MTQLEKEWIKKALIHDLTKLITDCSKFNEKFLEWKKTAINLTTYAVEFRYPGEEATKEEAIDSFKEAEKFSKFILDQLK